MMRFHRTLTPNREKGAHVSLIEIILLCYHIKKSYFCIFIKTDPNKNKNIRCWRICWASRGEIWKASYHCDIYKAFFFVIEKATFLIFNNNSSFWFAIICFFFSENEYSFISLKIQINISANELGHYSIFALSKCYNFHNLTSKTEFVSTIQYQIWM